MRRLPQRPSAKTEDYKAVYDKVFANTAGYVKKYKHRQEAVEDGKTAAAVQALVSKQKFEEDWANIAHTVRQMQQPARDRRRGRGHDVRLRRAGLQRGRGRQRAEQAGGRSSCSHDITLMDRSTAASVSKRDICWPVKDDEKELAAVAACLKADVLVLGKATAKHGQEIEWASQKMYQYTATLNVRVIQADSAQVLASQTFGPITGDAANSAAARTRPWPSCPMTTRRTVGLDCAEVEQEGQRRPDGAVERQRDGLRPVEDLQGRGRGHPGPAGAEPQGDYRGRGGHRLPVQVH